jgi:diguanylate cyclase (GGDEF)-like protein/PAS domain S-box-containing protein
MSATPAPQSEHEALLTFLYMCPVGVLRAASNGDVQMLNPVAAQLLLPVARTPVLKNLFDALEDCAPELRALAAQFSKESGSICQQHRIYVSSGGPGPRVIAFSLLKIDSDCLMAVLEDVTQQVEQERKLRQDETMFAALLTGVNDFALFSLDRSGRIDSWNRSGERQTGFTLADVEGQELRFFSVPDAEVADNVADQIHEAVRKGWSLRDRWCRRRDGSRYWCQMMVAADREIDSVFEIVPGSSATRHSPIAGFAVVLRDVTEQRVTGQQLLRLLTTDNLTGASNRGNFFDVAQKEILNCTQGSRPLSALMLDLDHFKQVNDSFGHPAGDALLQRFVTVCRTQLRAHDVIARIGGDEFAILLPDTDLTEAVQIAARIRVAVREQVILPSGGSRPVIVSIGCATLTPKVAGVDALLKAADEALYYDKRENGSGGA